MPPKIALLICTAFVLWLLYVESKQNPEASRALWIPTIWMLISGSRPLITWFVSDVAPLVDDDAHGSPLDRVVLSTLILLAILVLTMRKNDWPHLIGDNFWLILLYGYLGLSILWSDYPGVSAKRWIRLLGMVPVALVVASERYPLQSLESLLRRCAYVLIPFSYILIHYFPHLGRQYNTWSGDLMWTGVSLQKNGLGQICMIFGVFLFFIFLKRLKSETLSENKCLTFADGSVLAITLILIIGPGGSYSATSLALFLIALFTLLFLTFKPKVALMISARLKAILIILAICYPLIVKPILGIMASITGRDETLTGRDQIWEIVLDYASRSPIFGVGYGGFWGLGIEEAMSTFVGQAHSGYIDVYLHTGIIGVILLAGLLLSFTGIVEKMIKLNFSWGIFGICFLWIILLYNYTESAFLLPGFLWSLMIIFYEVYLRLHACNLDN